MVAPALRLAPFPALLLAAIVCYRCFDAESEVEKHVVGVAEVDDDDADEGDDVVLDDAVEVV